MKAFLIATFFSFSLFAKAQENKKYVNNIGTVKELKVYGNGKIVIAKMIVNKTLDTKAYLEKIEQVKDSSGIWVTTIDINNKENGVPLFGLDIYLEFDKEVLEVNHYGIFTMSHTGFRDNKKAYMFKASQANKYEFGPPLRFVITSKEKITTKISGLAGKMG